MQLFSSNWKQFIKLSGLNCFVHSTKCNNSWTPESIFDLLLIVGNSFTNSTMRPCAVSNSNSSIRGTNNFYQFYLIIVLFIRYYSIEYRHRIIHQKFQILMCIPLLPNINCFWSNDYKTWWFNWQSSVSISCINFLN